MFRRPLDLPLDRDGSSRFLPWIIALMVYLASLALAAIMAIGAVVGRWDHDLTGNLTVQVIIVSESGDSTTEREKRTAKIIRQVVDVLHQTPGVLTADSLTNRQIQDLLEPWLGTGSLSNELDIPRLIDVTVDPSSPPDVGALGLRLSALAPGITVDDHRVWFDRILTLAQTVRLISLVLLACMAIAATATVVFTTRSGMAVHHGIIEILHLIGAHDGYIARQFQFHAMVQGFNGGLFGFGLAALTLAVMGILAGGIDVPLLPALTLELWQWGVLLSLPVLAAVTAMVTARITVLRALAEMP